MVMEFSCALDRKSTRLNSSHHGISYAVFCLIKDSQVNDETTKPTSRRRQPQLVGRSRRRSRICTEGGGGGASTEAMGSVLCSIFFIWGGNPSTSTPFPKGRPCA